MLITFQVEMPVAAFLAARGRVRVPRPERCPACGHEWLAFAGWWTRRTRRGPVDVQRVACGGCGATHSCWPDVLVARRVDVAEMIGAALRAAAGGAGHRPIAARLGVPAGTVRGWLRRFRQLAGPLTSRLVVFAANAHPTSGHLSAGAPLAMAVDALGHAAAAWSRLTGEPVRPWPLAVRITDGRPLG